MIGKLVRKILIIRTVDIILKLELYKLHSYIHIYLYIISGKRISKQKRQINGQLTEDARK